MDSGRVLATVRAAFAAEHIGDEPTPLQVESYRAIAALAAAAAGNAGARPVVVGICGPQGSGKSTTARIVQDLLTGVAGLQVATLSLDDLYLARLQRAALAATVHPLLATRGVPGTHDVARGIAVISRLRAARGSGETLLPRFDKAHDEPAPPRPCDVVRGRLDVLLLEGWCVGATAQPDAALAAPVNALEATADADGRWRRYVNDCLRGPYQDLYALIDRLVLLRAPRFERVVAWRQEQERALGARVRAAGGQAPRLMSDAEVARFVMHFERLTRHVMHEMPSRADLVIDLDDDREVLATRSRRVAAQPGPGSA